MKNFDKNQKMTNFIHGDCFQILNEFEPLSFDCVITSPPYFREREKNKHFNLNQTLNQYIDQILKFTAKIHLILKNEGSFWLNIGDAYIGGSLALIPSIIAKRMIEEQGWILNNDVIWQKSSVTPTAYKKRLTNSYEHFFHFVKNKDFYYNLTSLDSKKNETKILNNKVVSSSGVSGKNYKKLILESVHLSEKEKENAQIALNECLSEIREGKIRDFRILIRGHNKVESKNRIAEINSKGFCVIKSSSNKPSDVWEINPEKKSIHYAPFPEDLVSFPIKVTCPPKGIILDPFCGTGTTNYVALQNNRKSVGIDISEVFIENAKKRCSL